MCKGPSHCGGSTIVENVKFSAGTVLLSFATPVAPVPAREAVNEGYEVAFNQLQNHLQPLLATEDVQEGVFAMLQKRPPVFKGK